MFLIALWVLFFVTDDFVENDILNKKNDLQSKASFMGKIARPAFENIDQSSDIILTVHGLGYKLKA